MTHLAEVRSRQETKVTIATFMEISSQVKIFTSIILGSMSNTKPNNNVKTKNSMNKTRTDFTNQPMIFTELSNKKPKDFNVKGHKQPGRTNLIRGKRTKRILKNIKRRQICMGTLRRKLNGVEAILSRKKIFGDRGKKILIGRHPTQTTSSTTKNQFSTNLSMQSGSPRKRRCIKSMILNRNPIFTSRIAGSMRGPTCSLMMHHGNHGIISECITLSKSETIQI